MATTNMDASIEEGRDALYDLHRLSVDSLRGFQKMIEKATPGFRPVAERYCAVHSRHVDRLDTMVREMGGIPDSDGSLMGSINRSVASVRSLLDDVDANVLKQVHDGEENVLALFDRASAEALPQGHREALHEMQAELEQLLAETRPAT